MLKQLPSDTLTSHVSPNYALAVYETFDHWHHMRELGSYIHNEGAFQSKKVCGKDWRLMHK